jgi:thiol-disulfide isomerase/thioredoxin
MNRYFKLMILVLSCLVLVIAACAPAEVEQQEEAAMPEAMETADASQTPAPEAKTSFGVFETKDQYGNDVNQSIFADANLTMVNVWATFCGPCLSEMPDLKTISDEMADKNVQIIGIVGDVGASGEVTEEEMQQVNDVIEKTGADYTHLMPSQSINSLVLNNIYAFPTTIFVDRDGNIVGSPVVGSQSKAQWEELINAYLTNLEPAYAIEDMNYNPGSCCG